MVRTNYGEHAHQTGLANNPVKDISAEEWNKGLLSNTGHVQTGMFGPKPAGAEVLIATGNLSIIDTNTQVGAQTGVTDDLANILTADTDTTDWGILVSTPGDTITVKHQAGGAGEVTLLSGGDTNLDPNVPMLVYRSGTDWYEFGGGGAAGGEVFTWTANHDANGNALEAPLFADPTITTKLVAIDIAGATAATTTTLDFNQTINRTITFPNATGTLLLLETANTYSGGGTQNFGTSDLTNITNINQLGYHDLLEIAEPVAPAANTLRFYAIDSSGLTEPHVQQSNGDIFDLLEDLLLIVRNTSGVTINKGEVVHITGSTGGVPNMDKAKADSDTTLSGIGVCFENVVNNAFAHVLRAGIITSVDTSAFTAGDELFLSATTLGAITNVKPLHPNHQQEIGFVITSGVSGSFQVELGETLGGELGTHENTFKIGDGLAGTKTLDFVNAFTASLSWTPTAARTLTLPDSTGTLSIVGHTHILTDITDVTITATNLNILDDGVDTTLHFHDSDRARANHTGTQLHTTISDFDAGVQTNRLDQMATPTADVSWGSVKITSLLDPADPQDAATKTYVDAVAAGVRDWKDSVRVATTADITLSGEQTIDGISTTTDRILVKNQTLGEDNGIYVTAAGAWSRSTDADTSAEVTSGLYVWVEEGTANGDKGFVLTTNDPIVLGTTPLSFTQASGLGQITAGTGLTKTGDTINVIGTASRIVANADSIDIDSGYVGQASITILGTIGTGTWEATAIANGFIAQLPALGSAPSPARQTAIVTAEISDEQITFAKMQHIATDRLLGRDTAATGDVEEIALNATLSFDGAGNLRRAALTGDVTAPVGSNTTTIASVPVGALPATVVLNDQANTYSTGLQNLTAATLRIPNSDTASVSVDGDIAFDNLVTDWSTGVLKVFGSGEEQGVVTMPIVQFTAPTDNHVVTYNATTDEFELQPGGGGSAHIIEEEGTPLTARANLNFIGAIVTASDNDPDTDVTVGGSKANFDSALSDGTFAFLNQANVFTSVQVIDVGGVSSDLTLGGNNNLADNAIIGSLKFNAQDGLGGAPGEATYAEFRTTMLDDTNATEDGQYEILAYTAGSFVKRYTYNEASNASHIWYGAGGAEVFRANTTQVLIAAGTNLVVQASGAAGYVVIPELSGDPGSADANTGRIYGKLVTDHTELFYEDELGTVTNVLTGTGDMVLADVQTSTGKKTFAADATNAGINLNSQTPSTTVAGDIWRLVDEIKYRNNADTLDLILATTADLTGFFDTAGTGLTSTGSTVNVIGTASRISVSADAIDIDSGYVGQASITTLGTIGTGTWEGVVVASAFLDADTMHLSIAQTVNGAKTFLDTDLLLRNVANTFNGRFTNTNTVDRVYTLQDADGTIAFLSDVTGEANVTADVGGGAISIRGSTPKSGVALNLRTIANGDGMNASEGTDLITLAVASTVVQTDQINTYGDFIQTFKDNAIHIENPAGTFDVVLQTSAEVTSDRILTIPLLGANRTIVVTGLTSQIALGTEVSGALANLSDVTAKTGSGTTVVMDTSPTIVTPTIASFTNAGHDHQDAAGGGTLLSTSALSDTANIAYLNTANIFTANQTIQRTNATVILTLYDDVTTPTDSILVNSLLFNADRTTGANVPFAQVDITTGDVTDATSSGILDLRVRDDNAVTTYLTLDGEAETISLRPNNVQELLIAANAVTVTTGSTLFVQQDAGGSGINLGAGTVDPSSPNQGDFWYRQDLDRLFYRAASINVEVMALNATQTVTSRKNFTSGDFALLGATSGSIIVNAAAVAGSNTLTFPAATGTVVVTGVADQLTNTELTSGVFAKITGLGVQSQDLEFGGSNIQDAGVIFLNEQASADVDQTGEGQFWVRNDTNQSAMFTDEAGIDQKLNAKHAIEFIIDGGGSVISTGIQGDIEIPNNFEVERVTMLAGQSGSIVVDIWMDTYALFPPTDADSITASAVPTITTDTDSQDTTLTGWTTALVEGSILRYNVDSVTTIQRVTISLWGHWT